MSATPELKATLAELDRRADQLVRSDENLLLSLKQSRLRSGLSIETVAERMSVPAEVVEEFEKYYADPPLSQIRRYAMAVNLEVSHSMVELPAITDEDLKGSYETR